MSKAQRGRGAETDELGVDEFVTDEVKGLNAYTYSDRVKDRLNDIGVAGAAVNKPVLAEEHKGIFPGLEPGDYFNGRLPVVIRKLELDQISALYSLFTSWFAYLTMQTNLIAAERSEALRQKEFVWSHIRKQNRWGVDGTKNSDQVCSDLARGDYRFVSANAKFEELDVLYDCMMATLSVTKQDMRMISREITIVQAKMEAEAVEYGFKGRMNTGSPYRSWGGGGDDEAENQAPPARRLPGRIPIKRPGG